MIAKKQEVIPIKKMLITAASLGVLAIVLWRVSKILPDTPENQRKNHTVTP